MHIIAISGTNGSGKDTLADLLASEYNFMVVSLSDILRNEAKKRGLSIERHILREVGYDLKKTHGPGTGTNLAVQRFERAKKPYAGLVICSLRSLDEANRTRELGGSVIWVDADQRLRYERTMKRKRGSEDQKTLKQFKAEEAAEMKPPAGDNPYAMNMAAIKADADIVIMNDGDDLDAFREECVRLLGIG